MNAPQIVTVPVKPAWSSKINWVQFVGIGSALLIMIGDPAGLSAEQQAAIVAVINMLQGAITWIVRTWFTHAIITQSIPPADPITEVKTN